MKPWRIFWKAKAKETIKDPIETYLLRKADYAYLYRSKYEIVRSQFKANKSANFKPKLFNRSKMLIKLSKQRNKQEKSIKTQEKEINITPPNVTPPNVIVRASGLRAYIGDPLRKIFSRSVGRNSFLYEVTFLQKELNISNVRKRRNSLKEWILDEYVYAPKVNWWFLEQPPEYLKISYAERHCYWALSLAKSFWSYIMAFAQKFTIDTSNLQSYSTQIKWILIFIAYIVYRLNTDWVVNVQGFFLKIRKGINNYYYNKLIDKLCKDVLENPTIHEKCSGQLIKLVRIPRIKQLMTNLFVRMLYDDGFDRNTYKLTHKIIIDYLNTKHCENKFTDLIIQKVLENSEVRQNLFNLLQDYVLNKDAVNLKNRAEFVLQAVLRIEGVRRYSSIKKKIDNLIYSLIVNNAFKI